MIKLAPLTEEDKDGLTDEEIEAFEAEETEEEEGDDSEVNDDTGTKDGGNDNPDDSGNDSGADDGEPGEDDKPDESGETDEDDKPGDETDEHDTEGVEKDDAEESEAGDQEAEEGTGEEIRYPTLDPNAVSVMSDDDIKKLDSDLIGKIGEYDKEMKALKADYDNGDIDTTQYMEKYNDIRDKIRDARDDVRAQKAKNEDAIARKTEIINSNWKSAQEAFFSRHKEFSKKGILNTALVTKVNALLETTESQEMTDMEILQRCHKEVVDDMKAQGLTLPGEKSKKSGKKSDKADKVKKAKAEAAKKKGVDLSEVPVETDIAAANWMDRLDILAKKDPEKFEDAIEELSEDKYRAYMKRHR